MTKTCGKNNINQLPAKLFLTLVVMGVLLFGSFAPHEAYAGEGQWYGQACTLAPVPQMNTSVEPPVPLRDTNGQIICKQTICSTAPCPCQMEETPQFKIKNTNIVSDIILSIKKRLFGVAAKLYVVTIASTQYVLALQACLTLYIVIYGIMFTTGMAPVKTYDFVTRMIKVGIVAMLTSQSSWSFFNTYVVTFFDAFTDNTIIFITNAGNTGIPIVNSFTSGLTPLSALDGAVGKVISSRMFAALMAAALTNDYGPFYFILMILSIFSFIRSIMLALWVYVMSLVIKTLLIGLAPLFIPTILFQRTKHIFDGWLAQLVNASLQPILLFIFFIFFVKLMEGSVDNILHNPICFSTLPQGLSGTTLDFEFWRFMDFKNGQWQMNTQGFDVKGFPIDLIAVLTFFTIAEIAGRFNQVVIQIATQISQASTNLAGEGGPISAMYESLQSRRNKEEPKA